MLHLLPGGIPSHAFWSVTLEEVEKEGQFWRPIQLTAMRSAVRHRTSARNRTAVLTSGSNRPRHPRTKWQIGCPAPQAACRFCCSPVRTSPNPRCSRVILECQLSTYSQGKVRDLMVFDCRVRRGTAASEVQSMRLKRRYVTLLPSANTPSGMLAYFA